MWQCRLFMGALSNNISPVLSNITCQLVQIKTATCVAVLCFSLILYRDLYIA